MVIAYVHDENAELTAAAAINNNNNNGNGVAAAQLPIPNGNAPDGKTMVNPPDVILGCKKLLSVAAEKSISEKIIKCFSVRDNLRAVMSAEKPATAIPVIDGFK